MIHLKQKELFLKPNKVDEELQKNNEKWIINKFNNL